MNRTLVRILLILIAVAAVALPAFARRLPLQVARNIMLYMAHAISWDMLHAVGADILRHCRLFGIGAYAAILGVVRAGMPTWLSIPFAAVLQPCCLPESDLSF